MLLLYKIGGRYTTICFKYFYGNFLIHHLFTTQASVTNPLSWPKLSGLRCPEKFMETTTKDRNKYIRDLLSNSIVSLNIDFFFHIFLSFFLLSLLILCHAVRMTPELKGIKGEKKNQEKS